MSKITKPTGAAQALLEADLNLRKAGDAYTGENDETAAILRDAALRFADAWRACEGGKGRP